MRLGAAGYTSANPTGPIDYSQNQLPGQGVPTHTPLHQGPVYPRYPYGIGYPYGYRPYDYDYDYDRSLNRQPRQPSSEIRRASKTIPNKRPQLGEINIPTVLAILALLFLLKRRE